MMSNRGTKADNESLADTARETADEARAELHTLRAKLKANGAKLESDLHDAGERFSEGARKFGDAAAEQVRAHPLAAFGIAFAAGLVVSRLLRSR